MNGWGDAAVIGALATAIVALVGTLLQNRKIKASAGVDDADAAERLNRIALGLVDPLQKRVEGLEAQLDACRALADELRAALNTARAELAASLHREAQWKAAFAIDPKTPPVLETVEQAKARRWYRWQHWQVGSGLGMALVILLSAVAILLLALLLY